jgi:phosphatidylserine decarboxylase
MPFLGALREMVLYQTWVGRLLLTLPPTWWFLQWQHSCIAAHANSPASKKDIPSFIKVRVGLTADSLRYWSSQDRP